jgi:hypothetical protein
MKLYATSLLQDRQFKFNSQLRRIRATIVAFVKTVRVTYSEGVFGVLGI